MHSHFLKKFLKETLHFSERWLFLKKWNNAHRGLSCHKCKKKFCHHKVLANFHIKALLFFILFFFGYSVIFVCFSFHILWIWYAARCVHFTVPSGRRSALFFLWKQIYTSGSTFIKNIESFVYHSISISR